MSDEEKYFQRVGKEQSDEFEELMGLPELRTTLIRKGVCGEFSQSKLRSLLWRIYFGVLDVPKTGMAVDVVTSNWRQKLSKLREDYADLKKEVTADPRKSVAPPKAEKKKVSLRDDDSSSGDEVVEDPLSSSADSKSAWGKYYQQQEVLKQIDKDLGRISQTEDMFEEPSFLANMRNILFVWSAVNTDIGYRQGMHDLCSCLLFYCTRESEFRHKSQPEGDSILHCVLDPKYLEADCFALFDGFMSTAEWKEIFAVKKSGTQSPRHDLGLGDLDRRAAANEIETVLADFCYRLQTTLLQQEDEPLFKHFQRMSIEACTYGTRWFRLLFLREFPIRHCGIIWDVMFAEWASRAEDDPNAKLSDGIVLHIGLAMLIYLREDFLKMDYAHSLRRLMKYPPVEDPMELVRKAFSWYKGPLWPYVQPKPVALPPMPEPVSANTSLVGSESYVIVDASVLPPIAAPPMSPRQARNVSLGKRLESLITDMNAFWFPQPTATPEEKAALEEKYFVAIAELKRVRDILLGDVDDPTASPLMGQNVFAPPPLFRKPPAL